MSTNYASLAMAPVQCWLQPSNEMSFNIKVRTKLSRNCFKQWRLMNNSCELSLAHSFQPLLRFSQRSRTLQSRERLVDMRTVVPQSIADWILGRADPKRISILIEPHVNHTAQLRKLRLDHLDGDPVGGFVKRHECDGLEFGPVDNHKNYLAGLQRYASFIFASNSCEAS
jgi:hypothetical protein